MPRKESIEHIRDLEPPHCHLTSIDAGGNHPRWNMSKPLAIAAKSQQATDQQKAAQKISKTRGVEESSKPSWEDQETDPHLLSRSRSRCLKAAGPSACLKILEVCTYYMIYV